jgi:hypothetical protein
VTAHARAPIEVVFAIVAENDFASWSPTIDDCGILKDNESAPGGVGTIRMMRAKDAPMEAKEVINLYWPPYIHGYRILEGAGVIDHQGLVSLVPTADGTQIAWHLTGNCADPSTLDALRAYCGPALGQLAEDLAAEAERRVAQQAG